MPDRLQRMWRSAVATFVIGAHAFRVLAYRGLAKRVFRLARQLESVDDSALRESAVQAGLALRRSESNAAYARLASVVHEAVRRETGCRLNRRQIEGGAAIFHGTIAEMQTGEGKTLTAIAPAAAAAFSGRKVHVITVNDYLARRDHETVAPVFQRLGIRVGLITRDVPDEERRAMYACPVVYVSNSEVAFDHLRDRTEQATGRSAAALSAVAYLGASGDADGARRRIAELDFALIDEADSVLVDEARTPLLLSAEGPPVYDRETCEAALDVARLLKERIDYRFEPAQRMVSLTRAGRDRIQMAREAAEKPDAWSRWDSPIFREEIVRQALAALLIFESGRDYVVRDDKILIVDEYTGRVFEDRSWSEGQHQLIEAKEGLDPTPERRPIGRLTYQSLFARYNRIGGMTGTIAEASGEVWRVYGLRSMRIPTFRPSRRAMRKDRIFASDLDRNAALVRHVQDLRAKGAPVLIGTRTVASSKALAACFHEHGIETVVLNAENEAEEAEIVRQAGTAGRLTIATNMAGRGTDIRPDDAALQAGGLHVIITERHDSRRIDRQLEGRAGRQGDPGVTQAFLSLEDRLLAPSRMTRGLRILRRLAVAFPLMRGPLLRLAQRRLERAHGLARWRLFLGEQSLDRTLAVSGERE